MAQYTDFFIGKPPSGLGAYQEGSWRKDLPCLACNHIDTMKLDDLWSALGTRLPDERLHNFALFSTPGSMLVQFPRAFTDGLANLCANELSAVAARWLEGDEMRFESTYMQIESPADLLPLLRDLQAFAGRAADAGKPLLLAMAW